jgi:hypothetical protein
VRDTRLSTTFIAGMTDLSTQTTAVSHAAGPAQDFALAAAIAIALIAAATIAGAWLFQLVLDIVPCPMCLEQRWAYYGIIPLAVLIAIGAKAGAPRGVLLFGLAVIALAALGNAGYGANHAGVEWKFWPGPSSCTGNPALNLGGGSGRGLCGRAPLLLPERRSGWRPGQHFCVRFDDAVWLDGRRRGRGGIWSVVDQWRGPLL